MSDEFDDKIQQSFDREAVRDAVLNLANDLTDGHADPSSNIEAEASCVRLADLLGNVPHLSAAEGIQSALQYLWIGWRQGA